MILDYFIKEENFSNLRIINYNYIKIRTKNGDVLDSEVCFKNDEEYLHFVESLVKEYEIKKGKTVSENDLLIKFTKEYRGFYLNFVINKFSISSIPLVHVRKLNRCS